jgi:streptogramin lyase
MKTTVLYAIMSLSFGALAAPAPAAEAVAAAAHALEARSGEYLGGIDVNIACREQYGNSYYAAARGGTCNDWKCTNNGNWFRDMDTPRACSVQHGLNNYAYCSSGINGWGCYRV